MTRRKISPASSAAAKVSYRVEHPTSNTTIRAVSVLPNKKRPVGYVAHCFPCMFSTAIMCDEISFDPKKEIETGYEAAKRLLNDHLKDCPYHISVPN